MIEAFGHPPLTAGLIRRQRPVVDANELISSQRPSSLAGDLRFFATAYVGALIFFLAWLA